MFAAYHLVLFTDFVKSLERRFDIGWILLGLLGLNTVVNLSVLIAVAGVNLYRKLKLRYLKKKQAEIIKRRQAYMAALAIPTNKVQVFGPDEIRRTGLAN